MDPMNVGLMHPGQMGVTIGAAMRSAGHRVVWASSGRGASSAERAKEAGLEDVVTLAAMSAQCDAIVSVCPPEFAVQVAEQVAQTGFAGRYLDLNAISPERARQVMQAVTANGAEFVDGGIIGPPALKAGTTRVYLSGPRAEQSLALFAGSLADARVVDDRPGSASALKMAYAAYTKGTSALLIAVRALARAEGVERALLDEWTISIAGLEERTENAVRNNAFKAWRFVAEMEEIAHTFAGNALPDGFHRGAADLYRLLAGFKDVSPAPSMQEALDEIDKQRAQR